MITVVEKQYMEAVIQMNRRMREAQGNPDWEQRRYEIAKDVLCALISNPETADAIMSTVETAPMLATDMADRLIAELKKEKTNPIK